MFKVGDVVVWESQAGGYWTQKVGQIIARGHDMSPTALWSKYTGTGADRSGSLRRTFASLSRRPVSYLVAVKGPGKSQIVKVYCPTAELRLHVAAKPTTKKRARA